MSGQHPVEIGQVWEYDERSVMPGEKRVIVDRNGALIAEGLAGATGGWTGDLEFLTAHATLLSPAPVQAAPDRTKCHPDCGEDASGHCASRNPGMKPGYVWIGDRIYCTQACADARVPPLSATPVPGPAVNDSGTAPVRIQIDPTLPPGDMRIKDVDQVVRIVNIAVIPSAQEAPKAPVCERGALLHGGPVLLRCVGKGRFRRLCDQCYLANEPLQKGPCGDVLHKSDVPERLPKPKLAHSMGVEDPALEDA